MTLTIRKFLSLCFCLFAGFDAAAYDQKDIHESGGLVKKGSDILSHDNYLEVGYFSDVSVDESSASPNDISVDIDGNGEFDALTDGLLILRAMSGLTGNLLIDGATASNAVYTSAAAITSRINSLGTLTDIDGNGRVDALTDGLLIIKYLFGLRDDSLIIGSLADNAVITSADEIGAKMAVRTANIVLKSGRFIAGTEATFATQTGLAPNSTLSYSWSLEKPNYSLSEIDDKGANLISFKPDALGQYALTLGAAHAKYGTSSITKFFSPVLPTPDPLPAYAPVSPPVGVINDDIDAVRFLMQSTFGPTEASVEELLNKGGESWFNEQVTLPYSSWTELRRTSWIEEIDQMDDRENGRKWLEEIFSETAQNSPDQLRLRMAYILSQLFVISADTDIGHRELSLTDYWDLLGRNAFGNFRDLLEAVTLHPLMGHYLNMIGNQKADPEKNIRPDENFAREVMQLFTIGLRELDQDGSVKIDSTGEAVETYDQETITQYAAALTGWYYDTRGLDVNKNDEFSCTITCFPIELAAKPMVAFDYIHQKTEKRLLRGYYIPPGRSAESDLKTTLDSLFNHPNLAPFFSMHLIRQMVTSNPSPAFIARVSAVFNNNGQGVRGDIRATLKAVLFDPEARSPDVSAISLYGKVKEPLLTITHLNRLFKVSLLSPETISRDNLWGIHKWMRMAGKPSQRAFYAESVFNFFRPDYAPNGVLAEAGHVAPELQITTEASIVNDIELFRWVTTKELWEQAITNGRDPNQFAIAFDFSPLDQLWEDAGFEAVIDHLNLYMTGNRMDEDYKANLLSFSSNPDYASKFDGEDPSWGVPSSDSQFPDSDIYTDKMERHSFLLELIYLIISTPEFRVQR